MRIEWDKLLGFCEISVFLESQVCFEAYPQLAEIN